ncbi:MAG: hypothetical protein QOJ81_616, partial [Chloroflexota bacterium]|nr:hypothetical protein [Chloroflexota bacterium]
MSELSGPGGSVTLMFTDIEGSTKLLERLREGYAQILETHRRLLRGLFEKHSGWEVDTQGDSFFVAFGSALDAVMCAADIQRALASEQWPDEVQVRVRIGLHTGEPVLGPTGYVGVDVHRGARVGAAAHGGQVLVTHPVRDAISAELPEGTSLVEVGVFRFKGLNEPTSVLQLRAPGLDAEFPEVRVSAPEDEPPLEGEPPYKGLLAFEAEDVERFFGREDLIAEVLHEIGEGRFLAVVGASGSGKSSLVRAGVIPALCARPDSRTLVMTPTAHPWEALGAALGAFADVAALAVLADGGERTTLVVDQFEELFTLTRDDERRDFITALAAHSRGSLHVLITLRADFYAGVAEFPALRELVAEHQRYIGPMSVQELRRAIIEPAKRGGWDVAPGLVDLLLRDVGNEPGALPLLSHALLETWRRRRGSRMTLKGYFEAGEVRGAIARTADRLYGELAGDEQELVREMLLRLTELGEGTQDTRRRAAIDELVPRDSALATGHPRDVLQRLVDARLVTVDEGAAEVAHEALIREWPRLREWLQEDRAGLRVQRQITEGAAEWRSLNRERSLLFRGARLAAAREWAAAHPRALNEREGAFVAASIEDEEAEARDREAQQERALDAERRRADEQAASNKQLRRRAYVLVGAMLIAAGLGVTAVIFAGQANEQALASQANAQRALEQQQLAEERQQEADQQRDEAETQQHLAQSRQLAAEALNYRSNLGLSLLLSLEAVNSADTVEAVSTLFSGLETEPRIATTLWNGRGAIAFVPHSRLMAVATGDQKIAMWDIGARMRVAEIAVPQNFFVTGLAFDPSGTILAAGNLAGEVQLFDVATRRPLGSLIVGSPGGFTGPVTRIAFTSDGETFWAIGIPETPRTSGARFWAVTRWNVSTQREIGDGLAFDGRVTDIDLSPDGALLA